MNKKTDGAKKKLQLNRETLRAIEDADLEKALAAAALRSSTGCCPSNSCWPC